MRKTLVSLFAVAALAAPVAYAKGTPISVTIEYDSTMLATEAGAKSVLATVTAQATEACSYRKPVSGAISFDRTCRDDLVEKAIGMIRLAALEHGQATSYVFASLETEEKSVNR